MNPTIAFRLHSRLLADLAARVRGVWILAAALGALAGILACVLHAAATAEDFTLGMLIRMALEGDRTAAWLVYRVAIERAGELASPLGVVVAICALLTAIAWWLAWAAEGSRRS